MKATCRLACVLVLLLVVCVSVSAQDKMTRTPVDKIRLGALYKNDVADSYIKGIESAVDNTGMKDYVEINYFLYYYEQQGLEKLIDMITNKEVDIVLGPTDSGIFTRALERREELEAYRIPVISPLVTATADNQPEGWFFRTNVDVGRRVEAIHDYLNKCLIRSVAILYADTEFGRRAEESFRTELRGSQEGSYEPVSFESLQEARLGLRQILESRPEALGIFGSNADIVGVYNHLQCMNNRGVSYRPFLFTIMDARITADEVDDLYFVSVAKCDITGTTKDTGRVETPDEVETLAYDTCVLLLSEFKRMPPGPFAPKQFRDQFAALLRGPVKEPGPKTGMAFHEYRNSVPPKVFHMHRGEVEQVNLSQVISWPQKLSIKWELIKRRYGFWPMVNIGLLILIVVSVSILDLKRWYGKGLIKELLRPHLWLLIAVNFLLVFVLYFFLAERGSIRYDSVVTALIIAFTPSVLLRTTLFETPTGRAIGLAKLYDRFLLWINDKLMMAKYRSHNSVLNLVAYRNSVFDMKNQLLQIYRHARNRSEGIRLKAELEEELQRVDSLLERRFICARHLLRRLDWDELQGKGFIPENLTPENLRDPQVVIRRSVLHCFGIPAKHKKVEELLRDHLKAARQHHAKWCEKAEKEYSDELRSTGSAQGKLHVQIRFLYVQLGFGEDEMKKQELLPNGEEANNSVDSGSSSRKGRNLLRTWFRPGREKKDTPSGE